MSCRTKTLDAIMDPDRVVKIRNRNESRSKITTNLYARLETKRYDFKDHLDVPVSILEYVETVSERPSNEIAIEDINDFLNETYNYDNGDK